MFISASRISPPYAQNGKGEQGGVQQILLLPKVSKACVLCNGTVTFYTLPELSPAFGTTQVKNCNWIGGVDLNEPNTNNGTGNSDDTVTVLLSLQKKIQVVRIGEDTRPAPLRNIEFAMSKQTMRRESIACVADSRSYTLLDVNRQLKIPLMSISSLDPTSPEEMGHAQSIAPAPADTIRRSASSAEPRSSSDSQHHNRNTSLGATFLNVGRRQGPKDSDADSLILGTPPPDASEAPKPPSDSSGSDKALPAVPVEEPSEVVAPAKSYVPLKPHIASPTSDEFLLVVGTVPSEVGIGMFVSLDGDTTRPTVEFEIYPNDVVVDGVAGDLSSSRAGVSKEEESYVLASLSVDKDGKTQHGIEIQNCDTGSESTKHWLSSTESEGPLGIRAALGSHETEVDAIVKKLCEKRFSPFPGPLSASNSSLKSSDSRTALSMEQFSKEQELFERDFDSQDGDSLPDGWEASRVADGEEFTRRLAKEEAKILIWSRQKIWWMVRNPLIARLDSTLDAASVSQETWPETIDKEEVFNTVTSTRGREAKSELEFLTFRYLQQKAGIILLTNLLLSHSDQLSDGQTNALETILMEGQLDPRVVLALIPGVRNEIVEGRRGIWVYDGVKHIAESFLRSPSFDSIAKNSLGNLESKTLHFLRRFLTQWRKRKGFGSVPDENEVFRTVEASLLLVLLELDRHSPKGILKGGAVRAELYKLADNGVDCFDRAVDLLESHNRLFVLSRLYQSRRMAGDVLATWKRIIEGERDDGGELVDGEERMREYLTKISSQSLVRQYGVWLAQRNPKLGVQVFADEKAKFDPSHVVQLLREEAPDAVRHYLEHLTFGKGHTGYINELVTYYLDIVTEELRSSATSREAIMAAYDAYRALGAPKPTYHHFLAENAPPGNEVWASRLRLLQLLGGPNEYDTKGIQKRISSLPGDLLVPEIIILAGRERHHKEALRLLVQKLGDYDSAVAYCLRGGISLFSTPDGSAAANVEPVDYDQQRELFHVVLREFLSIEDISDRVEQTGALLERFGGWFDVMDVLNLIPDTWSVDILSNFLVGALRRLVREKSESMVARALSGSQNLRVSHDLIQSIEEKSPVVDAAPANAASS